MISSFQHFIALVLCFLLLNFTQFTNGNADKNIETVRETITEAILNGTMGQYTSTDISDADEIVARIAYGKDGAYFPDVNYEDTSRSSWNAVKHLGRTERLAILYRSEEDAEKKELYKNCTLQLLDYWMKKDYQNSNWWFNRLSNPNTLGEIGILMKDDLRASQLRKLSALVGRGSYTVSRVLYNHAGANAIDLAISTIKFGALTGSRKALKTAVKVVAGELTYSADEGMKSDHTFFQHGNRIYMGGYGVGFVTGIYTVTRLLSGTDYFFTEKQLEPLVSYILDGMKVMSFGNTLDPITLGRSVVRQNTRPLNSLASAVKNLASVEEMPRKEEMNAYADSILNNTKTDQGVHYFDVAKFLVINNQDFYFSFRGGSNDMVYSEIINDENVLAYNSSFPGVTTIMHSGEEYYNISPVFDYSLVPGATAVYETDDELFAHEDFTYRNLKGIYGSAYDAGAAVSSARTVHEGIGMTVTCFAVDNAALLLGAGMTDEKGRDMITTVNQCFYAGDFTRIGNTVIHGGIKYTVYDGGELSVGHKNRTGDWNRANHALKSSIPAEGDIFTMTINNTGSYAYSVMGEHTQAEFEIIVNTEKVQAAKLPDGRIAAAFFADTSFEYGNETISGKTGDAIILS